MKTIIETKDLCKTYVVDKQQNNVLKNVNFSVEDGEMVAIMGPSGSGKSTLLYTISGMDTMTAGDVLFDGQSLNAMNENQLSALRLSKMGFVFQQMHMMRKLNIEDNILLPAFQMATNKSEKEAKIALCKTLMHKMGISDIAKNEIGEVSGGQLQRACICRALINEPKVIFADEPTGALNRSVSDEVMAELCRINREGKTIIMVSHDVKVSARCSRVLYLIDGVIRGQYTLGILNDETQLRDRERLLNNWLLEQGW